MTDPYYVVVGFNVREAENHARVLMNQGERHIRVASIFNLDPIRRLKTIRDFDLTPRAAEHANAPHCMDILLAALTKNGEQ